MPNSTDNSPALPADGEGHLYTEVAALLASARSGVRRAVNTAMVATYWHIGRLIVEEEQRGAERAGYGKELIKELSKRLTSDFGKGFGVANINYMRQFHLAFPILHSVRGESHQVGDETELTISTKRHALSAKSAPCGSPLPQLHPDLSWTHYHHLLKVSDPAARTWYMNEAAEANWYTRALERQIDSLHYERLLASKDKAPVQEEAQTETTKLRPEDILSDPYVLEFLQLSERPSFTEDELESALIDQLQSFLLELGRSFSFVARQKRITLDGEHFYIDLVFYNYLLKYSVVIDLKLGKLSHQDIGQIDTYVRLYEEYERGEDDNPTIGLVLCSEKNDAVAK